MGIKTERVLIVVARLRAIGEGTEILETFLGNTAGRRTGRNAPRIKHFTLLLRRSRADVAPTSRRRRVAVAGLMDFNEF